MILKGACKMPDALPRVSPLSNFLSSVPESRESAGVILSERTFYGHINLRGNPRDSAFLARVQSCIGVSLPMQTNQIATSLAVTAFCLGPDEWLLVTPPSTEHLAAGLHDALGGLCFSVTNITYGQTILQVSGDSSLHMLRKGCGLDLHPRAFKPGNCAQTLVAKAAVLLHYVDQTPSLNLIVRRSFAEYLALWIKDAAAEYGFRVI
jgi:sarcosine oxidase subunit gamma